MRIPGAVIAGLLLGLAPGRPQTTVVDPISGAATVLRMNNDYIMLVYGRGGTAGAIPAYAVPDTLIEGRWGVVAVGGDPTHSADNGVPISAWNVCQYQVEPQAYTAVQTPGAVSVIPWYRVGNTPDGSYTQVPVIDPASNTLTSVWSTGGTVGTAGTGTGTGTTTGPSAGQVVGVDVQEKLQLMRDLVRAEYKFVNTATSRRNVRVRLFVDPVERWPLVADGSWIVRRRHLEFESSLQGALVPNDWRLYGPDLISPIMIVQGILDRFDATRPDRFVIASAGATGPLQGGVWDYALNPSFRLDNAGGANTDDGGFTYYDTFTLLPGESKTIVTYTGLGCAYEDPTPPYVLATQAPRTLGFALGDDPATAEPETSYLKPRTFTIRAYLYNVSLFDINNANVYIDLPAQLALASGQSRVQNIGTVLRNEEGVASWDVTVDPTASGIIDYRVTASGVPVLTKTVTGSIEVPAQISRTFDAGLRMMSVPFQFVNADTQVALNLASDRFKLARYDPTVRGYSYFPDAFVSTIQPGAGYWFKTELRTPVTLQGASPVPRGLYANFIMPVKTGWNMIGSPYVYTVPWANTKVSDGQQMLTLTEATNAGWIRPTIFGYNTLLKSYEFTNVDDALMEPWYGYWLRADRDVFLVFPPIGTPEATIDAPNQRGAAAKGWRLQIAARTAGASDVHNYAGVAPGTPDGYDVTDIDEPPVPGEAYVSARFVHPEWGARSGSFTQDMRSDEFVGDKVWDLEVESNQAGERVTLTWPRLNASLPRGYTATLEDVATGRKVYLRTQGSYTYQGDEAGARRFRLIVNRRRTTPLTITGIEVRPLPGRAAGRSISFQLPAEAVASVRVMSVTGRQVRQVANRVSATAGRNTLVWDGTNEQGAQVSSGIVLVEITATDPEGASVQATQPVVLTR